MVSSSTSGEANASCELITIDEGQRIFVQMKATLYHGDNHRSIFLSID